MKPVINILKVFVFVQGLWGICFGIFRIISVFRPSFLCIVEINSLGFFYSHFILFVCQNEISIKYSIFFQGIPTLLVSFLPKTSDSFP